jgi:hypothetical protein
MGNLKVTIEHGSGLSSLINAKTVVIGAAVVLVAGSGGASGLVSGLTDLLYWVAAVVAVLVIGGGYVIYRATRHAKGTNYVRSINGMTQRDVVIEENAKMRRQLADIRAMRRQVEAARALGLDYAPGFLPRQHPGDMVWEAEVIEP